MNVSFNLEISREIPEEYPYDAESYIHDLLSDIIAHAQDEGWSVKIRV
jgi:hypothetical protein